MLDVAVTVSSVGLGWITGGQVAAEFGILLAQAVDVIAVVGTTRVGGRGAGLALAVISAVLAHTVISTVLAHMAVTPAIIVGAGGTPIHRRSLARGIERRQLAEPSRGKTNIFPFSNFFFSDFLFRV
jgi:hypothetical protein